MVPRIGKMNSRWHVSSEFVVSIREGNRDQSDGGFVGVQSVHVGGGLVARPAFFGRRKEGGEARGEQMFRNFGGTR